MNKIFVVKLITSFTMKHILSSSEANWTDFKSELLVCVSDVKRSYVKYGETRCFCCVKFKHCPRPLILLVLKNAAK